MSTAREINTDVGALQETIELMASYAGEALGDIADLARLALVSLEAPKGHEHIEALAGALRVICAKAQEGEGNVESQAVSVGLWTADAAYIRRQNAAHEARTAQKKRWSQQ